MVKKSSWFVYIILTKKNKLYTGITTDIERRFQQHINGTGAKYFRSDIPKKIVYQERKKDRSTATKREIEIKKLSRTQKNQLIKNKK